MAKPFRVSLAGLGTVGAGVARILIENRDHIAEKAGRTIDIDTVFARDITKDRGVDLGAYRWARDEDSFFSRVRPDAVVETIGGADGPALRIVRRAIEEGCHVVTSNKAMIAHHGHALAALAEEKGLALFLEGAVAGGIPIIKTLREGLVANNIKAIYGILNGTCNYIMTEMRDTGRPFGDILAEAQALGYAEADPSFDIDGIDVAHKIAILSAIAFGVQPDLAHMDVRGIGAVAAADFHYANELGYELKLLGIARLQDGRLIQTVEPCLIPFSSTISAVDGVLNAVSISGDYIGSMLSVGPGAGQDATASAVVADIIDLARDLRTPTFGIPASSLQKAAWGDTGEIIAKFYLRLSVDDRAGIFADVAAIMRDQGISMEAVLQQNQNANDPVSIVLTTHETRQSVMKEAVEQIESRQTLMEPARLYRIEKI